MSDHVVSDARALERVVPAVAPPPRLTYSDSESRRFGWRVFRGTLDAIAPGELLAEVLAQEVDMAFIRVPSARFEPARLAETGLPHLVADTLVHYRCNLRLHEPPPPRQRDLEFFEAGPEHLEALTSLVAACFQDYTNHYAVSPFLRREDWLAGYQEWARTFALPGEGRHCFLVRRGGELVAFATCATDGSRCEGVLYGVAPEAAGRGLYGDLLRLTQRHFKARGFAAMDVSTQIQNVAVQKFWSSEGFRLTESHVTVHLNPFLKYSLEAPAAVAFLPEAVAPFDAVMKSVADWHAGSGRRVVEARSHLVAPLEPRVPHTMLLQAHAADALGSPTLALAKVVDASGRIRLLNYHRVVDR